MIGFYVSGFIVLMVVTFVSGIYSCFGVSVLLQQLIHIIKAVTS